MTTRRPGGREAISHYTVQRKLDSPYGKFSLLEVQIDTGRTHQIRVHLSSLGHPVVGDVLYGARRELRSPAEEDASLSLPRNFLHAAALQFQHPRTGEVLSFSAPLPAELEEFLQQDRRLAGMMRKVWCRDVACYVWLSRNPARARRSKLRLYDSGHARGLLLPYCPARHFWAFPLAV